MNYFIAAGMLFGEWIFLFFIRVVVDEKVKVHLCFAVMEETLVGEPTVRGSAVSSVKETMLHTEFSGLMYIGLASKV
jgi:hypothetical protein